MKFVRLIPGFLLLVTMSCAAVVNTKSAKTNAITGGKPKVTFIELGSVNCVPCRMMQPIMEAVEKKYGSTVNVVFYDVWTEEGKPFGKTYRIRAIPTQVFLDVDGKEFFRHEGFFAEEDIGKVLAQKID